MSLHHYIACCKANRRVLYYYRCCKGVGTTRTKDHGDHCSEQVFRVSEFLGKRTNLTSDEIPEAIKAREKLEGNEVEELTVEPNHQICQLSLKLECAKTEIEHLNLHIKQLEDRLEHAKAQYRVMRETSSHQASMICTLRTRLVMKQARSSICQIEYHESPESHRCQPKLKLSSQLLPK